MGSHNTSQNPSRRGSTNESIDTEDEWYKHEIRELEQEEYEKKIEAIKPSASINTKLSHVLIELTATVAKIEYEDCQKHDKAMKAKQEAIPGPTRAPPSTPNPPRGPPHRGGLGPPGPPTGVHQPLAMEVDSMGQPIGATSEEMNDHKKVIMRFQGSEDFEDEAAGGATGVASGGGGRNQQPHIVHGSGLDQLDLEDEEDESSHAEAAIAKRQRGRRGRSGDESSPDSDATQSGPDSLMEDTGGSSDNILDSSNQEKRATKKEAIAVAARAAIVAQAQTQQPGSIPINLKAPVVPSTLPISPTTAAAARLASARTEVPAASKISPRISPDKSHKSTSSSGGSRRSRKSIKTASPEAAANGEAVEAGAEDWNDEDYANGGYYDENGEWVEASGYYDENGDWVETGGYYDESGEWVEYAGYYDENGEWVDVEVPETGFPEEGTEPHVEHQQTEDACDQYYEDTGGGRGMLG